MRASCDRDGPSRGMLPRGTRYLLSKSSMNFAMDVDYMIQVCACACVCLFLRVGVGVGLGVGVGVGVGGWVGMLARARA